jgi:hypothetical protein
MEFWVLHHGDVLGCPRRRTERDKFHIGVVARVWAGVKFDELVMEAYGCELSWRRAVVAWMPVALLRGYRGDV